MAFFYNETKAKPKSTPRSKARGVIPVQSLQQLGCSVCPRAKDEPPQLSPKLKPSGSIKPVVYLLGTNPSIDDDEANLHWCDSVGDYIFSAFGEYFMTKMARSNYIVQCHGEVDVAATECCRKRIVADIEETRPMIIVTIGDAPTRWALGRDRGVDAMTHNGTRFATKIGNHACWVIPLMWPRFTAKKQNRWSPAGVRRSPHQIVFEQTVTKIKHLADEELPAPWIPSQEEIESGIEIIDPNKPGIDHLAALEKALDRLSKSKDVGIDFETNGLRPSRLKDPRILTVAISDGSYSVAFPLDHIMGWGSQAERRRAWSAFVNFLIKAGPKIAHNEAMELEWVHYFIGARAVHNLDWEDSMALAHTLDERSGTKSLDMQTRLCFGFWLKDQSNVDSSRLEEYPIERTLRYNALDAKWTWFVFHARYPEVAEDPKLLAEYQRKTRLGPTLISVEARGMLLDDQEVSKHWHALTEQLDGISKKIQRTGEVRQFNDRGRGRFEPTNSDHVLTLLKDICHRQEVRVTDARTGEVSLTTSADVLETIPASAVPSVPLILEHRAAAKLLSTYIEPARRRDWVSSTGLVHCKYSSMVAVTGRLASEDPNQQNWPKRKNKEIRSCFVAPKGQLMVSFDYGQIEFRVVGMASNDPEIVKACWTGYDVHLFWAERIVDLYPEVKDWIVDEFMVDWDEKGIKTLRQEAKNKWVFPQLFGSSVQSCASQLHLPDDVTNELAGEFWDTFRVTKEWQEDLLIGYEKHGYVETLGGRKRRGAMTKNEAINMPIQGSAADVVTEGMVGITERGVIEELEHLIPVLNVHDDLTYHLPEEKAAFDHAVKAITEEMCRIRFDWINVPLLIEMSVGPNWYQQEEVAKFWSHEIYPTRNPYA